MKALKVGDVIRSVNYNSTGLKLGREYTVRHVRYDEFGPGYHKYDLSEGYGANHQWLEVGFINVVSRAPEFKVGDLVRIIEPRYNSIKDHGKMGIITRKHWEHDGVTMFGVVVQGCGTNDWSYANSDLELAQ